MLATPLLPAPKQCQYSPCLCECVARRRLATPSHKHGSCPPLGVQLGGPLKVQRWGFRVHGSGFRVQGFMGFWGSGVWGSRVWGFGPKSVGHFLMNLGLERATRAPSQVEGPRDPSLRGSAGGGGGGGGGAGPANAFFPRTCLDDPEVFSSSSGQQKIARLRPC